MRCPFCSASQDKVVETRSSDNDESVRRRRECERCGRRFTTYERIDEAMPLVAKKDGRREPYDRNKVLGGLRTACEKRPVPTEVLDRTIDEVERALRESGDKEVPSSRIGDAVLAALRQIDDVAYLRFASVYLSLRDTGEIMNEVQRLVRSRGETP